ncbi:hypothetical protein L1987_75362 [Smallanthus sonchifolius]|uniref:Uncharacterized protein n=1 Tax=Smallanthus sonchifolius TaxID=185202 RepID=A0ACB9A665_9ASTR|nr:hypothetical protein L1987_75362 [Smallanthus sonchifolius]
MRLVAFCIWLFILLFLPSTRRNSNKRKERESKSSKRSGKGKARAKGEERDIFEVVYGLSIDTRREWERLSFSFLGQCKPLRYRFYDLHVFALEVLHCMLRNRKINLIS